MFQVDDKNDIQDAIEVHEISLVPKENEMNIK